MGTIHLLEMPIESSIELSLLSVSEHSVKQMPVRAEAGLNVQQMLMLTVELYFVYIVARRLDGQRYYLSRP